MIDDDVIYEIAGKLKETIEQSGGKDVVIIYGFTEEGKLYYGSQADSCLNVIGLCRLMERLEIDEQDNKKEL